MKIVEARYRRSFEGEIVKETFYLSSVEEVKEGLREQNYTILSVREKKLDLTLWRFFRLREQLALLESLSTDINHGTTTGMALRIYEEAATPRVKRKLQPAIAMINQADATLSDALKALKFDHRVIALVQAGELMPGKDNEQLKINIAKAIDVLSEKANRLGPINVWSLWGVIEVVILADFPFWLHFEQIPKYKRQGVLSDSPAAADQFAQTMATIELISLNWLMFATCFMTFLLITIVICFIAKREGEAYPAYVDYLPFYGKQIRHNDMALSYSLLSPLILGKVNFNEALDYVIKSVSSAGVRGLWQDAKTAIVANDSFKDAIGQHKYIEDEERIRLIRLGDSVQLANVVETLSAHRLLKAKSYNLKQKYIAWAVTGLLLIVPTFLYAWIIVSQNDLLTESVKGLMPG
ncbi:membrane hypothetical protein [Candidatus Terasakiella magnetica]|uniref:Type II secretion system protein GspF domain-containing protein n=1 Tax=Candidatus Terasakiella magnetica TaxID=1867952 RepID=A0A1C3RLI8_9PROT|nr:hypothetical protein [Candidatus Terasakiella magnetica]SCA58093.1 membrane hypothetical protein [Candidatus Terasakiella magnetica]